MENKVWNIKDDSDLKQLEKIFFFLLLLFEDIFGEDTMHNENCIVYNDVNADCPMLIISENPIIIRLSQESTNYWAQCIFQLSHELCHYAIRQNKVDKAKTISWYEEIVCEAFSLYSLEYAYQKWDLCYLSKNNRTFYKSIGQYLDKEINNTGTDIFKLCVKNNFLNEYEKIVESSRETHRNERNSFYVEISLHPKDCKELCNYQNYICEDGITIDFEKWFSETKNSLIKSLWKIIYI